MSRRKLFNALADGDIASLSSLTSKGHNPDKLLGARKGLCASCGASSGSLLSAQINCFLKTPQKFQNCPAVLQLEVRKLHSIYITHSSSPTPSPGLLCIVAAIQKANNEINRSLFLAWGSVEC